MSARETDWLRRKRHLQVCDGVGQRRLAMGFDLGPDRRDERGLDDEGGPGKA